MFLELVIILKIKKKMTANEFNLQRQPIFIYLLSSRVLVATGAVLLWILVWYMTIT